MASLNEIATAFIDSVNQEFNIPLRERIKFHIKHLRAKFIRQDFEKNKISRNVIGSYVDKLIKVDQLDNCLIELGCKILRTENKVPKPVQTKGSLFQYVGSVNYGNEGWGEVDPSEIATLPYKMFSNKLDRWYYTNDYIYVITDGKYKYIRIESAFEDPEEAVTVCTNSTNCLTDDDEFPISLHMVDLIYKEMRSIAVLSKTIDDKEVTNDG
jgi:hypothetical protein